MKNIATATGITLTIAGVAAAGGPYISSTNPLLGSLILGVGILSGGILVLISFMFSRPSKEEIRSIIKEELVMIRNEIGREREDRLSQIQEMRGYVHEVELRADARQKEIIERLNRADSYR